MEKIVFVSGQRTPFGSFGGSLKDLSATDLGTIAAKATLEQAVRLQKMLIILFLATWFKAEQMLLI